jgi:hypothetical protein
MTRTLSLTVIALLGLSAVVHGQTGPSSPSCGPETWSTDSMSYVSIPCGDARAPAPQQASAPMTDAQYCMALVSRYDTLVNKAGKSGGMLSTNNAANVAAAKCRSGDASDMKDLERALQDARIDLPPRG